MGCSKIPFTKKFMIPTIGDCSNCSGYIKNEKIPWCVVFNTNVYNGKCDRCKTYIKEMTQCWDCIYQGDYPDFECLISCKPLTCKEKILND